MTASGQPASSSALSVLRTRRRSDPSSCPDAGIHRGTGFVIVARFVRDVIGASSLDRQIATCRHYARFHRLVARAAGEFLPVCARWDRRIGDDEALAALLAAAARKDFDVVLIEHLDQPSREPLQMREAVCRLHEAGVTVHVTVDGSGIVDEFALAFSARIEAERRRRCRYLASSGCERAFAQGRHFGMIPYGYRATGTPGRIIRDGAQAAVVRRIFEMFDEGVPASAIARILDAEGILSPGGRSWSARTIPGRAADGAALLRNTRYFGFLLDGRRTSNVQFGRKRYAMPPRRDSIAVDKPEWRIVDPELWTRVARRMCAGTGGPIPLRGAA